MPASNICFFIAPDESRPYQTELKELISFGPYDTNFSHQLILGINKGLKDVYKVRAITDGFIRIIPVDADKVTILLYINSLAVQKNVSNILKESAFVFIYNNVDKDSVKSAIQDKIAALYQDQTYSWLLTDISQENCIRKFMDGYFPIYVNSGDEIGKCGAWEKVNQVAIGFEIVYLPAALWKGIDDNSSLAGWNRIKTLIHPDKKTRRYDPCAFFYGINDRMGTKFKQVSSPVRIRTLLKKRILSGRILLELRNEYDEPIPDISAFLSNSDIDRNDRPISKDWGMVCLKDDARNLEREVIYTLQKKHFYFTSLPSGDDFNEYQNFNTKIPLHKSYQVIYLNKSAHIDADDWFPRNFSDYEKFTLDNKVTYLIDGSTAIREMGVALNDAIEEGTKVYFCNWMIDKHTRFGESRLKYDNLERLLCNSNASYYAMVTENLLGLNQENRLLVIQNFIDAGLQRFGTDFTDLEAFSDYIHNNFKNDQMADIFQELLDIAISRLTPKQYGFGYTNVETVTFINSLPNGRGNAAIDRHFDFIDIPTLISQGPKAHHQKFTIICSTTKTVAFCGGVDITDEKITHEVLDDFRETYFPGEEEPFKLESTWHDVHAKIEGPAVVDMYKSFARRWNLTQGFTRKYELMPETLAFSNIIDQTSKHVVSVTRTFNINTIPTSFDNDFSTLQTLKSAIGKAKHYIYIEDQYLTPYFSEEDRNLLLSDLLAFLQRTKNTGGYILMLTNDSPEAEPGEADAKLLRKIRSKFILALKKKGPDRVFAYSLDSRRVHSYIHSKIWIIDDIFVKIGSSNCHRRGYTCETELDVNIIDGAVLKGKRKFALELRLDLWSEHLRMQENKTLLTDAIHALYFWQNRNHSSIVKEFILSKESELTFSNSDVMYWNRADIFDISALNTL